MYNAGDDRELRVIGKREGGIRSTDQLDLRKFDIIAKGVHVH